METHEIKREKFPAAHKYVPRLALVDSCLSHLESHAKHLVIPVSSPPSLADAARSPIAAGLMDSAATLFF